MGRGTITSPNHIMGRMTGTYAIYPISYYQYDLFWKLISRPIPLVLLVQA